MVAVRVLLTILWIVFPRSSSSETLLRQQYPLYGLAEIAVKEYAKFKSACNNQMKSVFYGIEKREKWALKMLGASGAPVSGFVWGNNYWLGSYSQCQSTLPLKQVSQSRDEIQPFGASFYVGLLKENVTVKVEKPQGAEALIHLGLCIPSVCSETELKTLIDLWTEQNPLASQNLYNFTLKLESVRSVGHPLTWIFSPDTIGLGIFVLLMALLIVSGTLYDVYVWTPLKKQMRADNEARNNNNALDDLKIRNIRESSKLLCEDNNLNECCEVKIDNSQHKSMPVHVIKPETGSNDEKPKQSVLAKVALSFSITTNSKKIFNSAGKNKELSIVHGLRCFGMFWLIRLYLTHYSKAYTGNKRLFHGGPQGFPESFNASSTFAFDTFLFASGFLLAYKHNKTCCGSQKGDQTFSVKKMVNEVSLAIFRRFLGLTPLYVFVMIVVVATEKISKRISLFEVEDRAEEICRKTWWRNIAYVNNLFRGDDMCLSWSWYMSLEMQLYIAGLFILTLSTRFWRFTTFGSAVLVILSSLLSGYYGSKYNSGLKPNIELLQLLYVSPWARLGPYLIGMLNGYFIVHLKGELVLRKAILTACWVLSLICFLWPLSGLHDDGYGSNSGRMSNVSTILHTALSRVAWSFSLSWLTVACCTNNAEILRPLLFFSEWSVLNKLFFSAYLLSPLVFTLMVLSAESPVDLDSFQTVVYFIGTLIIIYMSAFFTSLMLEIPLANVKKQFLGQTQVQNQLT